jgi:hypothetical protein
VVGDGRRAVAGLSRPYDIDQFRDIAAAQSFADGHLLRDPFYRDETIWYNPLLPAVVAVLSRVGARDVPLTFVQAGPFLNALAPVALFVMTAALFGRWPAFIAVVSLLFSPPHGDPGWATPTYSPWLFPASFAPAIFYIGVLLCWLAARRDRPLWWLAAGMGLGATFLAHTAPALILGLCGGVAVVSARWQEPGEARAPGSHAALAFALMLVGAIVTSVPLTWSIIFHYHLRIVNPAPNNWVWETLNLDHAGQLVRGWLTFRSLPTAAGAAVMAFRLRNDVGARLLACWGLAAIALLAYGFLQQAVGFDRLPVLLPHYHFYVYLRAAGHVLTGIGTWALVHHAVTIVARRWSPSWGVPRIRTVSAAVALVIAVCYIAANLPVYRTRPQFRGDRFRARTLGWDQTATNVLNRLRTETPPDAVILASPGDSIFEVAPAGRSVVAAPREFSNPYVEFDTRADDQRRMLSAFVEGNLEAFRPLAVRRGVTHVLLDAAAAAKRDVSGGSPDGVTELSRRAGVTLYAVGRPDLGR